MIEGKEDKITYTGANMKTYIMIQKIPDPHLHKQIVAKTPK